MQAEVGVGMGFRVGRNFAEPGAGNHDAGGGDGAAVECVKAGGVFGVGDGKIVGVEDEELGIARVAEAFGDGFGLSEGGGQEREEEDNRERKLLWTHLEAPVAGFRA